MLSPIWPFIGREVGIVNIVEKALFCTPERVKSLEIFAARSSETIFNGFGINFETGFLLFSYCAFFDLFESCVHDVPPLDMTPPVRESENKLPDRQAIS